MASAAHILRLLAVRPRTNAELQDLCVDHGGSIARTCAGLIRAGKVRNIGRRGRGYPATYALTEADNAP